MSGFMSRIPRISHPKSKPLPPLNTEERLVISPKQEDPDTVTPEDDDVITIRAKTPPSAASSDSTVTLRPATTRVPALTIRPEGDLSFKGCLGTTIVAPRTFSNTTSQRLCYKIRSNGVDLFSVWPGVGFIEPMESVRVKFAFDGSRVPAEGEKYWLDVHHMVVDAEWKGTPREAWASKTGSDGCTRLWCTLNLEEDAPFLPKATLVIEPAGGLSFFCGPLRGDVLAYITLTNTTPYWQCYRIELPNEVDYVVERSYGFLHPGESLRLQTAYIDVPLPKGEAAFKVYNMEAMEDEAGDEDAARELWSLYGTSATETRVPCAFDVVARKQREKEEEKEDETEYSEC